MRPGRVDAVVDIAYGVLIVTAIGLIATLDTSSIGIAFGVGVFSAYVVHVVWKMARFDPEWMTREVEERVGETVAETVEEQIGETVEERVGETVEERVGETVEEAIERTVEREVDDVQAQVRSVEERVERRPREDEVEEMIEETVENGEGGG